MFRSLIESLPQNIFSMDREGRYTFANRQYCRTEGHSLDRLLGKTSHDFFPPDLAAKYEADNRQVMESRVPLDTLEVHQPVDGPRTYVQVIKTPVYDESGQVTGVLGAFWDVTPLKVAEEAALELNRQLQVEMDEKTRLFDSFRTELERQVRERTRELNHTLARQVELNQQLSAAKADLEVRSEELVQSEKMAALGRIVAGVAHEINSPVGVSVTAITYLDELVRQLRETVAGGTLTEHDLNEFLERTSEASGMVQKNLHRAVELVETFKKVAVDQTSEARRSFGLADYLRDTLRSMHYSVRGRDLTIDVRVPDSLVIDSYPGALYQVITNLVNNALLHAFAEGQPGTVVFEARLDGELVELVYQDDGVGIRPEDLPLIFDPFFTTKRGEGGSGLGLHIVYNLVVQRLKGTIKCLSRPGQGCRFVLRFPRVYPESSSQ